MEGIWRKKRRGEGDEEEEKEDEDEDSTVAKKQRLPIEISTVVRTTTDFVIE
jgi:hypothetical protein